MKRPPATPPMIILGPPRLPPSGGWVLKAGNLYCDKDGFIGLYDGETRVFPSLFAAWYKSITNLFLVGFPQRNYR